ncbi:MAG: bile acid:sodium symporter [Sphingobium sp.]|nr:bile acid:sodium symporter [Sphingobium sp.]
MILKRAFGWVDNFVWAMLAVVALAILWPQLGADGGILPVGGASEVGIALIFFLHGASLSRAALKDGAVNWRLHLLIQSCTFILFPLIGLIVFFLTEGYLPLEVRLGFFFLCAVSSTVSTSIAMVSIARGNISAAVFNATLSGLIGLVVTPVLIGLVSAVGAGSIPIGEAILDVSVKLLLPFLLGQLAPTAVKALVKQYKPVISKIDRGVILLIIYGSFCNSVAEGLWTHYSPTMLLKIFVMTALLLLVVLTLTTMISRVAGLSKEDEITAVFCGSKKSLANGAPIAKILFSANPALGMLLLPLMLYHQLQLLVCSALARKWAQRPEV